MADEMTPENNTAPAEAPEPVIHTMQDDASGKPAPLIAPPPKAPPGGAPPNIPQIESHPAGQPAPPPPPMRNEGAGTTQPGGEEPAVGDGTPPEDPFAGSVSEDGGGDQKKKMILIGGGILLILLLAGGGIIAWQQGLFGSDEPAPIADPTPMNEPDPEPEPNPEPVVARQVLTGFGSTSYVAASTTEAEEIFAQLFTETQTGSDPATIQLTDSDGSSFSLDTALLAAGVDMDPDVLELLDELYYSLLVIYDSEANAPRFAFVAAAADDTDADTLLNETLDWEETMPRDTEPLLRNLGHTSDVPSDLVFAEFTRDDGRTIHYANITGPALALDYVIDGSGPYFIFATSRESMSAILDSL